MYVIKRGNRGKERVSYDKITARITHLCVGLSPQVVPELVARETIASVRDNITTEELDLFSAGVANDYILKHPDYGTLATRIYVSNLHKSTPKTFSECTRQALADGYQMSKEHAKFIMDNARELDQMIVDARDNLFSYFALKALEQSYFVKVQKHDCKCQTKESTCPGYKTGTGTCAIGESSSLRNELLRNGSSLRDESKHKCGHESSLRDECKHECDMSAHTLESSTDSMCATRFAITRVMDRPQYMIMRVAIAVNIHDEDPLGNIRKCYKSMSQMEFCHATPTLYYACAPKQQLLSCFLLGTEDSIERIMENLTNVSLISKAAGGVAIHMSNIRAQGARLSSTGGAASGVPKQLMMYNGASDCWDQGGRRKGAFAIYLEPWQADIMTYLQMKLPPHTGGGALRATNLFYALWVPDLFKQRVEEDSMWSLFSEDTAPGLSDVFDGMMVCTKCGYCNNTDYMRTVGKNLMRCGTSANAGDGSGIDPSCTFEPRDVFTELYTRYERENRALSTIRARVVMDAIKLSMRESGIPYMCSKDDVNRMSNHSNIGTIKSSNLCTEIMQWSSADSYACCCLAAICLREMAVCIDGVWQVDHNKLHTTARMCLRNTDNILTESYYPIDRCRNNAEATRSVSIGIQGLANLFIQLGLPFDSPEAAKVELEIAETIYHGALTESCERAKRLGPYPYFAGSPASQGLLAPDLWLRNQARVINGKVGPLHGVQIYSGRWKWDLLRDDIRVHGLRNALMQGWQPTVSTSQLMGNNESFEPFPSNIYAKNTLAGKFTVINEQMVRHLVQLGLWSDDIKNQILSAGGSIQGIEAVPQEVRRLYPTVWEIKQSTLMRRASIRGAFIDQSQSLNIYPPNNNDQTLYTVIKLGWDLRLKTGSYYVRTKPAADPLKINNAATRKKKVRNANSASIASSTVSSLSSSTDSASNTPVNQCEEGCTFCAM